MNKAKKILITGNMGYIGPVLTTYLRSNYSDIEIYGIDLGFFGHCLTGASVIPESRVDFQYISDVRNCSNDFLKNIDAVIHLAAISNDPMGNAFEEVTKQINYQASVSFAKQAKEAGVKSFVFASSCSVYGYAEGDARNEKSELNPLTAYAKSKINTEEAIKDLADEKFIITSLRFPTACGMSDRLRLDLVLNDFVASAVASKKITILSDGTPWRPLIDVKDMSRAMDWGINRNSDTGGNFLAINVGRTEWNYQVKDLAEQVKCVMPEVEIEINTDAQPDKRSYRVDFSLYEKLAPNYQPQVNLTQTISELKDGLEGMQFSDRNFRDSEHIRLKVLSRLMETGLLSDQLEWTNRLTA